MLLEGKKLLVTGVLMDSSIAFHVAKLAQEQGAEVVLTSFGRTMKITTAIARRLPTTPPVVELDVTSDDDLAALADRVKEHVPHLDGVVHSIGFAPQGAFNFMEAGWDDVSTAVQVSAYSLASLTKAALPLMSAGGSVVGLTFDARFAWPVYDWMGVAKAAFESTNRYLARDLGPEGDPLQHRRGGPHPHHRGEVHPRASSGSRRSGAPARRSGGTSTTPCPPPAPAAPCSPTGSPPPPARWCTSTAASTRWASERSTCSGR